MKNATQQLIKQTSMASAARRQIILYVAPFKCPPPSPISKYATGKGT